MLINLTEQEFMQIKVAIMDEDGQEALRLLKEFVQRIEWQKNAGVKSHLDQ